MEQDEEKEKPKRSWRDNGFGEWGGYMEAKKSKLEEQFNIEAKGLNKIDDLFSGIAIFVNGYTTPSADDLRFLMMKHGGIYHHYYRTGKTTHIIASNLPDAKIKQFSGLKVVKPSWIVDSIEAGKVLDFRPYLLYTSQSVTQPVLTFKPSPKKNSEENEATTSSNSYGTKTASDEKFLSDFYSNSRLHLISTLGANLKQYVNDLRTNEDHAFPGLINLKCENTGADEEEEEKDYGNVIMHIDMDCFFVSVGLRNRPDLKGHPVAVTHAKGNRPVPREGVNRAQEIDLYKAKLATKHPGIDNGSWQKKNSTELESMSEIASCSYEARKAGLRNGMFLGSALKLCPNLKTIPYDFDAYKEVSYTLYDTVAKYTLDIEAVSCDEMYVDCTELLKQTSLSPLEFANIIRKEIKTTTGCPCSTGFGGNRLQARLATKMAKPDGQYYLEPSAVVDFMKPVEIYDLPGIGRSTALKLKAMGAHTCGDIQLMSMSSLQQEFGNKLGEAIYKHSFGTDDKELSFSHIRKSVSADVNYGIRFQNDSERNKFMMQLSEEVSNRLKEINMKGKSITLKVMVRAKDAPEESSKFLGHGFCDYVTRSRRVASATCDPSVIFREVMAIMKTLNIDSKDLRGLGIQLSRLENSKASVKNSIKWFMDPNKYTNQNNVDRRLNPPEPIPGTSKSSVIGGTIDLSMSQLDMAVVKELPEELQAEILASLKPSKSTNEDKTSSPTINENNAVISPKKIYLDNLKDQPIELANELDHLTVKGVKELIRGWVKSEQEPKSCDIQILISFLQKLIRTCLMEHVLVLMNSLYSYVNHLNSSTWKKAYNKIYSKVQSSMQLKYNSNLCILKFND